MRETKNGVSEKPESLRTLVSGVENGLHMRTLGEEDETIDGDRGVKAWIQPRPHTQANARANSLFITTLLNFPPLVCMRGRERIA